MMDAQQRTSVEDKDELGGNQIVQYSAALGVACVVMAVAEDTLLPFS